MDMLSCASQVTLQNIPLTHPTSHPPPSYPTFKNRPSSIQMPPKNTHFLNYRYSPHYYAPKTQHLTPCPQNPSMQDPRYETHLHQVPWHHERIISFPIHPYQMSLYQTPPTPYQQPTYPCQKAKVITRSHIRKISSRLRRSLIKFIILWLSLRLNL